MLSFMLFAFVTSITPGPTNILVLSNSALRPQGGVAHYSGGLRRCSGDRAAGGFRRLLGTGSSRLLRSPQAMQRLNRCMALLLLGSTWLSVWV